MYPNYSIIATSVNKLNHTVSKLQKETVNVEDVVCEEIGLIFAIMSAAVVEDCPCIYEHMSMIKEFAMKHVKHVKHVKKTMEEATVEATVEATAKILRKKAEDTAEDTQHNTRKKKELAFLKRTKNTGGIQPTTGCRIHDLKRPMKPLTVSTTTKNVPLPYQL